MDSFTTFLFSSTTAVKADNMPLAALEDIAMTASSVPSDEERRTSGANCYCVIA